MSKDENDNGDSVVSAILKWWPGQVRGLHAILCDYGDQFSSLPFSFIGPKGHIEVQVIFPGCQ